jgi:nicotinate-nucleotide adenylyltransferase
MDASSSHSMNGHGPLAPPPLRIGVLGGSFSPIHLGHALLAITVQQTQASIDRVVLVPVYKHAKKTDLLPFDDRVRMCELAIDGFGIEVSRVEEETGESNGAMLKALKQKYPTGTEFVWICGDDFFHWMDRPKGIETLTEVSGVIVQRRLHRRADGIFYKEPIDEEKVRKVATQLNLHVEYIYGELPRFSSSLVRRAPGHWRSFLTQGVIQYLDERPSLLQQLIVSLENDTENDDRTTAPPQQVSKFSFISIVLSGLDVVHCLQLERGVTGLWLSTGKPEHAERLRKVQDATDSSLKDIVAKDLADFREAQEVYALASELQRVPLWLDWDRHILATRGTTLTQTTGSLGWVARLSLVEKFNTRVDVLIGCTVRALVQLLTDQHEHADVPELLFRWCDGKEALGRLRAFVSAGGPDAPTAIATSFNLRQRLCETVDTKDRKIGRVVTSISEKSLDAARVLAPEALHGMLEQVTAMEYRLLGSFSSSTPLSIVHKLLQEPAQFDKRFDVEEFFEASTAALDFLLSYAKALTATVYTA